MDIDLFHPMKTGTRKSQRIGRSKLAPPRLRTKSLRLPKRTRNSGPNAGLAPAAPEQAPALVEQPNSLGRNAVLTGVVSEAARADSSGSNTLELYLREIGQVKLLTPAEEIELAKRIKR